MLKQLYQLQLIETQERNELEKQRQSTEFQQLRKVKADFTHQKESYLQLEKDLAALDEQLAAFPAQMTELEEKISAENAAIYDGSVVNTKELAARESQIAALTEKLHELQSIESLYMGEREQKKNTIHELKRKMAADYEDFTRLKNEVQQLQAEAKQRLLDLEKQKKELESTISADELACYERVKNKCGGTPVAMLNADHVCSGCHTIVPPITFKRTSLGQKTVCENCGRTLFVEE